ncbi:MAG: CRISPR-associated endonuclease Cas1 [Thermoplasmata archaeon]
MLNEYVYCPRLYYLEWVQQEFSDSAETIDGRTKHRIVDIESGKFLSPENLKELEPDAKIHARSVLLSGEKCGMIARIDLIEEESFKVSPVEYKRGDMPKGKEPWLSDKLQVCAEAIILRENGYFCDEGIIYYIGSKQRVKVTITEDLINITLSKAEEAKKLALSDLIPPPLIENSKCLKCSLAGICLPDEITLLQLLTKSNTDDEIRRLYPARDDALPLYIQEQGAKVVKHNDEIEIKQERETLAKVRFLDISQLSIFGNVQITTQTIQELCRRDIPICYFSMSGWFEGITHGMSHKNVNLRIKQYSTAQDNIKSTLIASKFIYGKIRNCITMLRRNSKIPNKNALEYLKKLELETTRVNSIETLRGVEGNAARVYFLHFNDMLKPGIIKNTFNFESRNRRPPKDPINALLSFVYAILTKDFTVTLLATGFDPYLGFLHQSRYGKPALALDMMEEFRPIIGDSVVIGIINNGEISDKDFLQIGEAIAITPKGKKVLINAYERRMDTLITHPLFGYKVSYRRVLEVQARLLGRWLTGDIKEYQAFETR